MILQNATTHTYALGHGVRYEPGAVVDTEACGEAICRELGALYDAQLFVPYVEPVPETPDADAGDPTVELIAALEIANAKTAAAEKALAEASAGYTTSAQDLAGRLATEQAAADASAERVRFLEAEIATAHDYTAGLERSLTAALAAAPPPAHVPAPAGADALPAPEESTP